MRIHYHLSEYISHRRAGEAYMACLASLGHTFTEEMDKADLVILHESPHFYPGLLGEGRPQVPVVGYAVWETPQLPGLFVEGLRHVDRVWTCSHFSAQAFAPYKNTSVLPHVVTRPKVAAGDIAAMRQRLGMEGGREDTFYFYTIVDSVNPRKNLKTLLGAFAVAFPDTKDNVRLVVKQYREPQDLSGYANVIDVPDFLDDAELAALHAACHACVSAHHSEAWGLTLSEAMSFGNPVIATGYSGNMEFMDTGNSFPVSCVESPVSREMCAALPQLFSPVMTWADIDIADLVSTMRRVRARPPSKEFRAAIAQSVHRFSPHAIAQRLEQLLAEI